MTGQNGRINPMELLEGMKLHGFTVNRIREIKDCGGILYELSHDITGAQLCWMKRDDINKTFAITFKTIPFDDTGVFHILEHSVLNGSEKYPVREPFVELLKSSMQTFLNAFTYPDKTMYPVSSRNDRDFMNLMSVYLDAVFHPLIYRNPNIFYQEGWHYEIRNEEDEPVYKGVVLNEMKGAFASVDEILVDQLNRMVFKDNCYRFVSGGDPSCITDLTYEKFIETHSKFYHPSNTRVFLDGDMNIDEVLAFIDGEYFSKYEKEIFNFDIPMQEAVKAEHVRCEYEISPDEQTENRTQISMGKIISSYDQPMKNIAWAALASVLLANNESPLKKEIIDRGLAEDVELDLFDGIQQPWLILTFRNTEEKNYDELMKTVRKAAGELISEGIDKEQLTASLNMMEFRYRERHEPAGLMYGQRAMDSWLYGGDPALYLTIDDVFETLRNKAEEGYFEELLAEFINDEEHLSTVTAVPNKKLLEENAEKERQKLHAIKETWGDKTADYIKLNEILDVWQMEGDTEENLAALPRLSLSDLSRDPQDIPFRETTVRGVPVLVYPKEASGIVYMNLYFNIGGITKEHLPSLTIYSTLLSALATEKKTVDEIQKAIRRDLGSLSFYLDAYSKVGESDACIPVLGVSCSVLERNVEKAVDLILEIIQKTVFDREKILPILKQENEGFRQAMTMSGHAVAMKRIGMRSSAEGVFREYSGGYELGMYARKLEDNFDDMIDEFINDCQMYSEILYTPARLTMSINIDNENLIEDLISRLNYVDAQRAKVHYPIAEKVKEAIQIPAQISYSAAGINLHSIGSDYTSQLLVAAHVLTFEYLWSEVRVKGGAYGTGFSTNANGAVGAYSFRDPDPANTLAVYRRAGEYLRNEIDDDISQLIIGAVASTEPLLSPSSEIRVSDTRWFRGMTYELRQKSREQVLSMTADDLRSFADVIGRAMNEGSICIVGSRETIASIGEDLEVLKQLG